jgi:hypothetical protein
VSCYFTWWVDLLHILSRWPYRADPIDPVNVQVITCVVQRVTFLQLTFMIVDPLSEHADVKSDFVVRVKVKKRPRHFD